MGEIQYGFGFIRAVTDSELAICSALIGWIAFLSSGAFTAWQTRLFVENIVLRRTKVEAIIPPSVDTQPHQLPAPHAHDNDEFAQRSTGEAPSISPVR
jgi:hypothetical protein